MDKNEIMEIVESVFTFDDIGDAMMAVRSNLEDKAAQEMMVNDLKQAALDTLDDPSEDIIAAIEEAAKERTQQYVTSCGKGKGTGCGG